MRLFLFGSLVDDEGNNSIDIIFEEMNENNELIKTISGGRTDCVDSLTIRQLLNQSQI